MFRHTVCMHPDLAHALSVLDIAIRQPATTHGQDRRCEDAYEAITTLEALGDYAERYADTLWRLLAVQHGPQARHQALRVLEVLRGCATRR